MEASAYASKNVTGAAVTSSMYLFYTSLIAFLIFLIMFFIHYFFVPFLPSMFPSKLIVPNTTGNDAKYDSVSLYANTPANSDEKMDFTPTIKSISTDKFTLSFDCFLNGTYLSTNVPRVLFYFGGNKIDNISNSNFKEYKGDSEEETPMILNSTTSDLLNKITGSNFVIYVDPVKNDMKIGVYTVDTSSTKVDVISTKRRKAGGYGDSRPSGTNLEIASIIKNIPINKVFKVTMVLTRDFVEVYMNKKLVDTYKIGSLLGKNVSLNSVGANYGIYTPIGFIGNTVKIGKVQFYNGALTSVQIRDLIPDVAQNTFFNP